MLNIIAKNSKPFLVRKTFKKYMDFSPEWNIILYYKSTKQSYVTVNLASKPHSQASF